MIRQPHAQIGEALTIGRIAFDTRLAAGNGGFKSFQRLGRSIRLHQAPAEIERLLRRLNLAPRELMRRDEPEYRTLGLDDPALDRAALIEALGSAAIAASADRQEGVAAFRDKRSPSFPGT